MPKGIRCVLLPVLEWNATPSRVKRRIYPPGRWHLAVVSLAFLSLFVSPPSLFATEFQYDDLDRLERAIYPDGRAIGYSYDNVGNRLSREVLMVSVSPLPSGPSDVGTTVTVRASVLGGSGTPHEFQFWRRRGAGDPYLLVRDFGAGDNVVWSTGPETNTLAETYRWRINGRRPGSTLAYETFGEASYTLTVPAGGYYTATNWGTSADNVVIGDFDGDGKTDIAVWCPSDGVWGIINSSTGVVTTRQWGTSGDSTVPMDFDGDGMADIAVWRPSEGQWWILHSSNGAVTQRQWGTSGDIPVPGDFDGDGNPDIAVWRPSEGQWWIFNSSNGSVTQRQWGTSGDELVPGDYDGDGKTDIAVWRPSEGQWWILNSSNGSVTQRQFGTSGDVPVPGDYDGDGKTDIAVWRPPEGQWWILNSSNGSVIQSQWGVSGDVPVPGDYDGDGKTDIAVWRPSTGVRLMRFF